MKERDAERGGSKRERGVGTKADGGEKSKREEERK